jgi:signal transduction histidine kinase
MASWIGVTVRLWRARGAQRSELRRQEARADDERLRREVIEERLRLSREVHDVVGHSLSVISMQAGAALHVFDRRPDDVHAALCAIQDCSRTAYAELREALRAMRGADQDAPPGARAGSRLADLPRLIDGTVRAGVRVDLVESGQRWSLPAAVQTAVYRIVQEALTNSIRHGHASAVRVSLAYSDDGLLVGVTDDGSSTVEPPDRSPGPGAGQGIEGMRERARDLGGWLTAAPVDGGFRVQAWLPVRPA